MTRKTKSNRAERRKANAIITTAAKACDMNPRSPYVRRFVEFALVNIATAMIAEKKAA